MQSVLPSYTRYFKHLLPLSNFSGYSPEFEHSDKIVVPLSVYYDIQRAGIPTPPLFTLLPEHPFSVTVYAAPLSYTAEEGCIYIPHRLFTELGFKVYPKKRDPKAGHGVYLHSVQVKPVDPLFGPQYILPEAQKVKIHCDLKLFPEFIRRQLTQYTVLKENSVVTIAYQHGSVSLKIVTLLPEPVCSIRRNYYSLEVLEELPVTQPKHRLVLKKSSLVPDPTLLEGLPEPVQKIPRFLSYILSKEGSSSPKQPVRRPLYFNGFGITGTKPQLKHDRRSRSHLYHKEKRELSCEVDPDLLAVNDLSYTVSPVHSSSYFFNELSPRNSLAEHHSPPAYNLGLNLPVIPKSTHTINPHKSTKHSFSLLRKWYDKKKHGSTTPTPSVSYEATTPVTRKKAPFKLLPGFVRSKKEVITRMRF